MGGRGVCEGGGGGTCSVPSPPAVRPATCLVTTTGRLSVTAVTWALLSANLYCTLPSKGGRVRNVSPFSFSAKKAIVSTCSFVRAMFHSSSITAAPCRGGEGG